MQRLITRLELYAVLVQQRDVPRPQRDAMPDHEILELSSANNELLLSKCKADEQTVAESAVDITVLADTLGELGKKQNNT